MAVSEALAQLACLRKGGRLVVRSTLADGTVVFTKRDPAAQPASATTR